MRILRGARTSVLHASWDWACHSGIRQCQSREWPGADVHATIVSKTQKIHVVQRYPVSVASELAEYSSWLSLLQRRDLEPMRLRDAVDKRRASRYPLQPLTKQLSGMSDVTALLKLESSCG